MLSDVTGQFSEHETLDIGGVATATARSTVKRRRHWFLVQDGGYPTESDALLGVFRSPLWIRRNRFVETIAPRPAPSDRRSVAPRLSVRTLADALAATRAGLTTRQVFSGAHST